MVKLGGSYDKPLLILRTNPITSYNIPALSWKPKEISSLEPSYSFVAMFSAGNREL